MEAQCFSLLRDGFCENLEPWAGYIVGWPGRNKGRHEHDKRPPAGNQGLSGTGMSVLVRGVSAGRKGKIGKERLSCKKDPKHVLQAPKHLNHPQPQALDSKA